MKNTKNNKNKSGYTWTWEDFVEYCDIFQIVDSGEKVVIVLLDGSVNPLDAVGWCLRLLEALQPDTKFPITYTYIYELKMQNDSNKIRLSFRIFCHYIIL